MFHCQVRRGQNVIVVHCLSMWCLTNQPCWNKKHVTYFRTLQVKATIAAPRAGAQQASSGGAANFAYLFRGVLMRLSFRIYHKQVAYFTS